MKLSKKFAIAVTAAVGIGGAVSGCSYLDGSTDRYIKTGMLGSYILHNEGAKDSFEGSKRILRWDIAPYEKEPGNTILYIFDTAKSEICEKKYKLGDVKGKAVSSDCDPASKYEDIWMESIKAFTCKAAGKDPVNGKDVLAYCANTDRYGKKLPQPAVQ